MSVVSNAFVAVLSFLIGWLSAYTPHDLLHGLWLYGEQIQNESLLPTLPKDPLLLRKSHAIQPYAWLQHHLHNRSHYNFPEATHLPFGPVPGFTTTSTTVPKLCSAPAPPVDSRCACAAPHSEPLCRLAELGSSDELHTSWQCSASVSSLMPSSGVLLSGREVLAISAPRQSRPGTAEARAGGRSAAQGRDSRGKSRGQMCSQAPEE